MTEVSSNKLITWSEANMGMCHAELMKSQERVKK